MTDRLDRIEESLLTSNQRMDRLEAAIEADSRQSRERMARLEASIEADSRQSRERMARLEASMAQLEAIKEKERREDRERLEEIRKITQSNAKAIQAMADQSVTDRLHQEETLSRHQESLLRMDRTINRLTNLNEGVVNLLSFIDEDRPTIFRKLNAIEHKIDRLLDNND